MNRLPLIVFVTIYSAPLADAAADRPNVVLMMADDLAAEDLSLYGGDRIRTPRLDALAGEGMWLTSYYAGSPVCSPSRMALLSGSYPARLGWRWGVQGFGFPPKSGMSPRVHTLAEVFRDAGYRTAISGKWHLGVQNMAPEQQGFDSAYYIRMSNNQNRDMMRDGKMVKEAWNNRTLTETFAEECIRVIEAKSAKPFFLYVPWSAPHFPAEAHPNWKDRHEDEYVDVVEELDARIGDVLDALRNAGKVDDTIVIFTSDNGRQRGQSGKSPMPIYRGQKWQSLEGGTRVPCIVRWPKKVPAGKTSDAIVSAIDLFPTLASMCGVPIELPKDAQQLDGLDCKATLLGEVTGARTELLYWHGRGQATGLRVGDWKLLFNYGHQTPGTDPKIDGPQLYDLSEDPKEQRDVAANHPERVRTMMARAKALLTEIYANQLPLGYWEGVKPADGPLRAKDVWGKWIDQ